MVSTRLAFAALAASLAVPALAQDASYQLVNDSGLTLMEFYTSVADEGAWGDDILGANVLATGQSGTVSIPGGGEQCDRDLRFVFEDGSEVVRSGVNVCDSPSFDIAAQ